MKKIKKVRVADEVFEQMKLNITDGVWKPGEKIPSEMTLCKIMGVSRVSIREALHRLVGLGVLNIKHGGGTFVSEAIEEDAFSSLLPFFMVEEVDFREVLEFRRVIDLGAVALAAQRADEEEIRQLFKVIERMKSKKGNTEEFSKADLEFHTSIALASKNKLLIKVTALWYSTLHRTMDQSIKVVGYESGINFHTAIANAIAVHDEKEAFEQMKKHYEFLIKNAIDDVNIGIRM